MYSDHLRLIGMRVVDFLLVLIELFSLAVTAEDAKGGQRRSVREVTGSYGLAEMDERGDCLINFCSDNVFTALHGMQTWSSDENSVCLSVCLSVCQTRAL